jgi:osmotically-inducible protein OsmY
MDPTYRPMTSIADDAAVTEALRTFACALGPAAADVRVEFHAGVVTLAGCVASATQRQAIEDLVAAHDGVDRVASELRVAADGGVIAF